MELLITLWGQIYNLFYQMCTDIEPHLSCLGKITLVQHLGFWLKCCRLIEERAKKLLGFQFCHDQLVNLLLCPVKSRGKDSQTRQAGPGRGRGALGWIPGETFIFQHHLESLQLSYLPNASFQEKSRSFGFRERLFYLVTLRLYSDFAQIPGEEQESFVLSQDSAC